MLSQQVPSWNVYALDRFPTSSTQTSLATFNIHPQTGHGFSAAHNSGICALVWASAAALQFACMSGYSTCQHIGITSAFTSCQSPSKCVVVCRSTIARGVRSGLACTILQPSQGADSGAGCFRLCAVVHRALGAMDLSMPTPIGSIAKWSSVAW